MSRPLSNQLVSSESFPRVSGDEPFSTTSCHLQAMFSPRERG